MQLCFFLSFTVKMAFFSKIMILNIQNEIIHTGFVQDYISLGILFNVIIDFFKVIGHYFTLVEVRSTLSLQLVDNKSTHGRY